MKFTVRKTDFLRIFVLTIIVNFHIKFWPKIPYFVFFADKDRAVSLRKIFRVEIRF